MYKTSEDIAKIQCLQSIDDNHNRILWYKQSNNQLQLLGYECTEDIMFMNVVMQHNMMITFFCISFNIILVSGSSLSDQVHQNPADMYKNPGQTAEITCSHRIDTYNQILWYKQTKTGQLQLLGYMFITNPSLEPGVTVAIDGNANKDKNCTLTIKDLFMNSSAVYFCAARYHSATYH
ncbi:unnamed protein product [Oreochromis niloticus]|nr:unnamed protein product [Mustela putorius furo]